MAWGGLRGVAPLSPSFSQPGLCSQVSGMISLPVSCQVGPWLVVVGGGGGYPRREPVLGRSVPRRQDHSWGCGCQPAFALLLTEVAVAPLDELRGHKALVKLRSRQERDLRELHKKHQRKAFALTRRLLDSLAQARPGVP